MARERKHGEVGGIDGDVIRREKMGVDSWVRSGPIMRVGRGGEVLCMKGL